MYNVPSEIILAIAGHLRLDISHRTTLSSLCLVDKRTYHLAKVYLYRHVELNSNSAITKFRQTLTVLCPHNAVHVNTLNVYPLIWHTRACSSNRVRKDLVPDLRSILNVVSNLKHLYLAITRKALVLLLADIKPVFSLYSMAHSGDMSKPLLKFLSNQPEIVNHGWYSLSSWKMCRLLQESMTQDNRFLGHLRSAIGPANFLAALMRRRPLTSITILIYTWRYKNTKLDDASASCGGVTGWVKAMYEAYAGGIGLIPPRESLKEIRIAETQLPMRSLPGSKKPKNYMRSYLQIVLRRFSQVERLEVVSSRSLPHNATPFTVHPWLLEMNDMSMWNQIAPSLKYVSIYGYTIPRTARCGYQENGI